MTTEWVEIVPPLPEAEAKRRLEEIRRSRVIRDEDLRRDQVLTDKGCLVRYLIKQVVP
jgi:hypothetical protein